jgi:putative glutamine amidotransferase
MGTSVKLPVVGVVTALTPEDHSFDPAPAYRFEFVKQQYYECLEKQGLLPLIVPASERHERANQYCDILSGLMLVGGEDVNPELYGEPAVDRTRALQPRRDYFEKDLILQCLKRDMPFLGICRGLQMLNVALGGSLYQDISFCPGAQDHRQQGELDFTTRHRIEVVSGSRLHSLVTAVEIEVNTGHHQCIRDLGRGLTVSARAEDGVIEAVEGSGFALAVQWHPESWNSDPISVALFSGFAAAVRSFAEGNAD